MKLTTSLVTYKNNPEILHQTISSLFNTNLAIELLVIDNSPTDELRSLFENENFQEFKINYYFNNGNNVGFAKAHNLAIEKSEKADYHLVLNPDVYFEPNVIPELISYLEANQDIGLISPKILFPNGEIQYLCKRYPSFFHLFARRFVPSFVKPLIKDYLDWYEMKDIGYDKIFDVPYLSGCFMLFRRKALDEIGYFDENIFMYLEDADITLRMSQKYRAIFYPSVNIYHHWARGSHKSLRLTFVTIQSAIYLFNKYGWKFL